MKARFDVESAKLDASKQEILSKIDGAEAQLKVADAEQKLNESEEKLKADRAWSSIYAEEDISGGFCFIFSFPWITG